mmetsp:Transcript_13210/g.34631  ORF Transcript_13210/g.34631 Transcript_13210/m.34631 type:complete len:113 (-) Transcript_13210:1283-1621(-)
MSLLRQSIANSSRLLASAFRANYAATAGTYLSKDEVTQRVLDVVKNYEKVDPAKVTPEAHFSNDLGLDSLDNVEVVMALEDEFVIEIPDQEADRILTLGDAIKYISEHPQAK